MKTRIKSALIMLPALIFLYFGGIPLLCIVFALSAIAMHEFYRGFLNLDVKPKEWMGYISLICLYIIIIWGEFISGNEQEVYAHLLLLWVFGTVSAGLFSSLLRPGIHIFDGFVAAIGTLYIGFFMAHIPLITRIPQYKELVWIVFIAALGSDTFAYFIGSAIGKNKLCPGISPHKTIEGCIGGILGAGLLCWIFGHFVYPDIQTHCLLMGLIGAGFSVFGDLIASMFKRKMGLKDYGNIIPGHGGVLDRFDSVILTAPFIYYYILIVLRP